MSNIWDDKTITRFWAKVDKTDGCWLWTAGLSADGYGRFALGGRRVRAHRFSFELATGRRPGLHVLHSCDTPLCVNPAHLREGTHAENMRDRSTRNRLDQRGARNPATVLTDAAVRAIRRDARPETEVALEYRVGRSTIGRVRRREVWSHL